MTKNTMTLTSILKVKFMASYDTQGANTGKR